MSPTQNPYLTTHNTHNRQTYTPPAGFESATPASKRPQFHALDREDTGIGPAYGNNGIITSDEFVFGFLFTPPTPTSSSCYASLSTVLLYVTLQSSHSVHVYIGGYELP
jgi:hypothetical protein